LLKIRRERIVPLIKSGFVWAHCKLLGENQRKGGVDTRWRTENGDILQIVANFADRELPMPMLVAGESLWRSGAANAPALLPNDIIVRLGEEA
jgi:maltooligosyltrehalose trehalohydrolase